MPTTEADWRTSVLPFTLQREGGARLSTDSHDPGNWSGGKVGKGKLLGTKYGIASASHPGLDVRHLTLAQASDIYWREYVVAPGFARLSLPLLLVAFDAGVNCGPGRAAKWVKVAERERGLKAQIASLTAQNLAYHKSLKTWPRYGKGWGARIAACEKQALLLLAAQPVPLVMAGAPEVVAPAPPKSSPHPSAVAALPRPVAPFPHAAAHHAASAPKPAPKPSSQPPAGLLTLFFRAMVDALFQGAPSASPSSPRAAPTAAPLPQHYLHTHLSK